jgi:hypothetical protein
MTDAQGAFAMRTTLVIDDDVLAAAKAIAQQQRRSIGEVVSELARHALHRPSAPAVRNGVPLLARRDDKTIVTLATVNALRNELP